MISSIGWLAIGFGIGCLGIMWIRSANYKIGMISGYIGKGNCSVCKRDRQYLYQNSNIKYPKVCKCCIGI